MLSQEQKDTLLKIARQTLESYIKNQKKPELKVTDPDLFENRGAFVTLEKQEKLRGCIGYVLALKPLAETVQENAINAAVNDPRFPPVSKDELKDIHIEISAMSPLSRIKDVSEIEVGKHGLYIKKGMSSGLLLPQVATDWNWNRDQFLENVCYKAGLSANAWKDKDAEIYIFSAEVFGE